MKKYLVLAALGIIACLGFNTATASAANCTTPTVTAFSRYTDGGYPVIGYGVTINGCSGVDLVRINYDNGGGQFGKTGFQDISEYNAGFPTFIHQGYLNGGTVGVTTTPGTQVWVANTCWYSLGHYLDKFFHWQYRSTTTHVWSNTVTYIGGEQLVLCP